MNTADTIQRRKLRLPLVSTCSRGHGVASGFFTLLSVFEDIGVRDTAWNGLCSAASPGEHPK